MFDWLSEGMHVALTGRVCLLGALIVAMTIVVAVVFVVIYLHARYSFRCCVAGPLHAVACGTEISRSATHTYEIQRMYYACLCPLFQWPNADAYGMGRGWCA